MSTPDHKPVRSLSIALCVALGCGAASRDDDGLFGGGDGTDGGDAGHDDGGDGDDGSGGEDGGSGDDGGNGDDGGGGDDGSGDDGGIKYDVGDGTGGPGDGSCDPNAGEDCGCTAVDLLFIIDNSRSMGDYQAALAGAFPDFVDAIVDSLPVGTDVHVGITTSEMNDSTMSNQGPPWCDAPPDADFWYLTPLDRNTGKNGTQGRLQEHGGHAYYEFVTDAPQAELDAASTWFQAAALVGEGGSNAEQAGAAAGWAADPANAATNAGFIRDEGAVLVLFFIGDEHDQTPTAAGPDLLNKLAAAKTNCGGTDCIVGGGFVKEACLPTVPMGTILNGLGAPPVVADIPPEDSVSSADFAPLLRDTLAQVIAQKCDEIPPVG